MKKIVPIVAVVALVFSAAMLAASKEYGKVKTTDKDVAVQFEIKRQKLVITSKEKKLPVGSYGADSYEVMVRAKGTVYRFSSGKYKDGGAYTLNVEKDAVTEVDLGPPFKITVGCTNTVTKQGQKIVLIGFSLAGKNGEYYQHAAHIGSRPVKAPALQIETEDGKVLETGKFEYG